MANYKKYKVEFEAFWGNYEIDMKRDFQSFSEVQVPDDWQKVVRARDIFIKKIETYSSEIKGALFFLRCMSYVNEDYYFEQDDNLYNWKKDYQDLLFDIVEKKFEIWKEKQLEKVTETA